MQYKSEEHIAKLLKNYTGQDYSVELVEDSEYTVTIHEDGKTWRVGYSATQEEADLLLCGIMMGVLLANDVTPPNFRIKRKAESTGMANFYARHNSTIHRFPGQLERDNFVSQNKGAQKARSNDPDVMAAKRVVMRGEGQFPFPLPNEMARDGSNKKGGGETDSGETDSGAGAEAGDDSPNFEGGEFDTGY